MNTAYALFICAHVIGAPQPTCSVIDALSPEDCRQMISRMGTKEIPADGEWHQVGNIRQIYTCATRRPQWEPIK